MTNKTAVIAIGGNSLIKDESHRTLPDQYLAAKETCWHIAHMILAGWNVVVAHGNGPQVGFILRRSELASHELHPVPLDICVADTQGAIGYFLQQNLYNYFRTLGINKNSVTIITQVEVDANDPAFQNPAKPIGSFMSYAKAMQHQQNDGWHVREDAGRGWRRVVASPIPQRIVEETVIRSLIDAGVVVIAAGGGGIPVIINTDGDLLGVAAVIDKDYAAAMLASDIEADLFIISTGVEKVALNFGKPNEQWLDQMTLAEAKAYIAEGIHFAKGSMAPKMQAAVNYLERGGKKAIITNPENLQRALAGETGTHIVP